MYRVVLLSIMFLTSRVQADLDWKWENNFSLSEQQGLINWIKHAESGIKKIFGPLPYSYTVHVYRIRNRNGPVPWAHTSKGFERAAHFHVNTSHAWEAFRKDWTAPHELSHLLFPYLGRDNAWFAEGITSYLQYQIMYANNTITWKQGTSKLQERFDRARNDKNYGDLSVVELSKIMHETGAYVHLYWSGAAYFLNVDKKTL